MTPVSSIALENALKERTAAARAAKPTKTTKTVVPPGKRRVTGTTKVEKAVKERNQREAKRLIDSAVPKARKSDRPHGHVPKPSDLDDCTPRDRKLYTPAILKVACPKCGAKKGTPCISDTPTKCELRSPHKPRINAAA